MNQQPAAIVTGGSRGIGRAIASRLAGDGYAVVVNFHSNRAAAEATVAAILADGGEATAAQANVAETADQARLLDACLSQYQRLDVLVNNAGITSPGRHDLLEATPDNWDTVMATNLKGPFFLAQSAARLMIDLIAGESITRGTIVNVSSISAYAVSTNRADYCVAKAGMQMMTWLLAARLAEEAIRVYEICPGVIASDMTRPVRAKYDQLIADGLSPMRRWGQPEDVAQAVSAVVSGQFPFSTGERINVDGGFHIRRL